MILAVPYLLLLAAWYLLGLSGACSTIPIPVFPVLVAAQLLFGLVIRWNFHGQSPGAWFRFLLAIPLLAFPATAALWFGSGVAARLRAEARRHEDHDALHAALWAANESWRRMGFAAVVGGVLWAVAAFELQERHGLVRGLGLHPWSDPLQLHQYSGTAALLRLGLIPATPLFALVLLRTLRLLRTAREIEQRGGKVL